MKRTIGILLVLLLILGSYQAQENKFGITIEPSLAKCRIYGRLNQGFAFDTDEHFPQLQYGVTTSFHYPVGKFNFGAGIGYFRRLEDEGSWGYYEPESLNTFKFIGYTEFGNATKRSLFSGRVSAGLLKGSMDQKYEWMIEFGPKLNLNKKGRNVAVAIHPFITYFSGEFASRTVTDQYGLTSRNTIHFRTTLFGASLIFEIKRKAKPTQHKPLPDTR